MFGRSDTFGPKAADKRPETMRDQSPPKHSRQAPQPMTQGLGQRLADDEQWPAIQSNVRSHGPATLFRYVPLYSYNNYAASRHSAANRVPADSPPIRGSA